LRQHFWGILIQHLQTGLVLVYKKLEGGSFHWPKPSDGVLRLSPAQFSVLFEGLNWRAVRAERRRRPRLAG
jgi:transposase